MLVPAQATYRLTAAVRAVIDTFWPRATMRHHSRLAEHIVALEPRRLLSAVPYVAAPSGR